MDDFERKALLCRVETCWAVSREREEKNLGPCFLVIRFWLGKDSVGCTGGETSLSSVRHHVKADRHEDSLEVLSAIGEVEKGSLEFLGYSLLQ